MSDATSGSFERAVDELTVSEGDKAILRWLLAEGFIYVDDRVDAPLGTGRLWAGTDPSDYPIHTYMPPFVARRLRELADE